MFIKGFFENELVIEVRERELFIISSFAFELFINSSLPFRVTLFLFNFFFLLSHDSCVLACDRFALVIGTYFWFTITFAKNGGRKG